MGIWIFKKGAVFLALVLFCASVGKCWHYCKDGFGMRRIQFDFSQQFQESAFDLQLKELLAQKYFYLSRGHQCYAFVSEDGKYILKLPRADLYKIPFWLRACSFSFLEPLREERLLDKKKRLHFLMDSFSLAYEELQKETAVLYLHLAPTKHLKASVAIHDPLGRRHFLDLDRTAFVFQEKKPLMIPLFQHYLKEGDRERAQAVLEAFIQMVAGRAKKGIFNKDPSFLRNFGYDGKEVIQIDIGSFYRPQEKKDNCAFSFQQTISHVALWLSQIDPEMEKWFQLRTEKVLRELL